MTFRPDDWPRVKGVFAAALEVDGAARAAFVAAACGDEMDLRRQVETLLTEHQRAEWIGRTIATYRVTGKIGSGGMGDDIPILIEARKFAALKP